ncbi:MAG: Disulfide bond formation protein B [Candidatus Tokpelaia sp. JSC189]|nr:MAG: Disulfide bond formation protein B [Candidatus Tokpelaia sp. JSC189]
MMLKSVLRFHPAQRLETVLAIFLFIAMSGTVLAALGFQYIGGLMPCKLCLMERFPYYIGAPLMLVTALLSAMRVSGICVCGFFIAAFLLMLYDFALSVYHAGVEWTFWRGPLDCTLSESGISMPKTIGKLLDDLNMLRPVSCSEAVGYFFAFSMAGWNAIAALGYAAIAALAVFFNYNSNCTNY